jgi:mono/diheme cytochrome c family protein
VNGLLSALAVWDRQFSEARSHSRFRIGYTGNGAGALRFDLGETAVFTRALPAEDIWTLAMRPMADQQPAIIAARESLAKGDPTHAVLLLQPLSDDGPLSQEKFFTMGEAFREQQNWDQSLVSFQRLSADPHDLPLRATAAYEEAALLAGERRPAVFQKRSTLMMDSVSVADVNASQESITWVRQHLEERQQTARADSLKREFTDAVKPLLSQQCAGCHPSSAWQHLSQDDPLVANSMWKSVETVLQSGTMPPQDTETLDIRDRRAILHWIRELPELQDCREQLKSDARSQMLSSIPVGRRLNRGEFVYCINDLFGVQPRLDLLPPSEGAGGEGFDTAAGTLIMSSSTAESFFASVEDLVLQWKLNRQHANRPHNHITSPADSLYHVSLRDRERLPIELRKFLRRAWRKTPSDEDLRRLVDMFNDVVEEGHAPSDAMAEVLTAVLLSPQFLYLLEEVRDQSTQTQISQSELAARMAFFLWSSVPDDELMNLVERDALKDEEFLNQAGRMLADERAGRLGIRFGLQWLGIDQVERLVRDANQYSGFSPQTADLMKQEAARFIAGILCKDRPLEELFTSEYVWRNKELASFHGQEWSGGDEWAQLTTSEKPVAGILTLSAVLATNAYPSRTSPVLRGRWILDRILGQRVLPAPADVPALEQTEAGHPGLTLRQQLEQHRKNPNCRACHQLMDPLGFALEEFDSIGRFQHVQNGRPIDVAAVLPDGTEISGVAGLRQALLARRRQWLFHLARKLTGFAIGREISPGEHCLLEEIVDRTEASGGTSRALIHSILQSDLFQQRR